jgi:hypothetical protein
LHGAPCFGNEGIEIYPNVAKYGIGSMPDQVRELLFALPLLCMSRQVPDSHDDFQICVAKFSA